MRKEIVVLGAGKIGRGSVGRFFTQAGWQVDFYGHDMDKMRQLEEQGYYTTRSESGVTSRVEGFTILDCSTDDELVDRLAQVNVCAVCAYEGAFPSMATSIAKAIRRRVAEGNDEPLNVMLCVNDVHVIRTFDDTIRPLLDECETAYYESSVGLCLVMVMSLGANAPEGENPWLVLVSDDPSLQIDGDDWKGERLDVDHISYTTNGQGLLVRKVFVGNMSHAMRGFLGYARGMRFMDDGVYEDTWILDNTHEAVEEALFAVGQEYHFDRSDEADFRQHVYDLSAKPAHDPFTRICNSPAKKLSYDNRFIWPARVCLKHGVLPFYLARGAAYGLGFLLETTEGYSRPTDRDQVRSLVSQVCGLGEDDALLRDLICDHYADIPGTQIMTTR